MTRDKLMEIISMIARNLVDSKPDENMKSCIMVYIPKAEQELQQDMIKCGDVTDFVILDLSASSAEIGKLVIDGIDVHVMFSTASHEIVIRIVDADRMYLSYKHLRFARHLTNLGETEDMTSEQ